MEEKFVPINFAPGYFVSNYGRIKKSSGKIMSTPVSAKGYVLFVAMLNGRRSYRLLHRVVAEHFIGPIEGMEINHRDFNKQNNHVENLEIVTRAENMAHYKGSDIANAAGSKISQIKIKTHTQRRLLNVGNIGSQKPPKKVEKQDFEIINVAALARRLGRRRHWFYQRLNGNIVNGKPAAFTDADLASIAAELRKIQAEIGALADRVAAGKLKSTHFKKSEI